MFRLRLIINASVILAGVATATTADARGFRIRFHPSASYHKSSSSQSSSSGSTSDQNSPWGGNGSEANSDPWAGQQAASASTTNPPNTMNLVSAKAERLATAEGVKQSNAGGGRSVMGFAVALAVIGGGITIMLKALRS